MSAPEQKARSPSPVTITARTSGRPSITSRWLASCASMSTVKQFSLAGLSSRSSAIAAGDVQANPAHGCHPIGPSASSDSGISVAFSATVTRPCEAATMSRAGSMPGMISVATSPSSVSRITQRSVT